MISIGLLSDTHGYLDPEFTRLFQDCDEVWHAGDIGDSQLWDDLCKMKPTRAVYGNIDGLDFRTSLPEFLNFELDGLRISMIHIAGPAGKYNTQTRNILQTFRPGLLVCGHSHILKVQYYPSWTHLYMNPGAAGQHGFHQLRTALRFKISDGQITAAEVIELGKRGRI